MERGREETRDGERGEKGTEREERRDRMRKGMREGTERE